MKLQGNLGLITVGVILLLTTALTLYLAMPKEEPSTGRGVNFTEITLSSLEVKFLGWVVEYDPLSASDFAEHVGAFTWVSPTGLYIDESGTLGGDVAADVVRTARDAGVLLLPLVANRNFDRQTAHKILTEAETRDSVISQLESFIDQGGYDGINIDFEDVPEGDRDGLTQFMGLLASRLRSKGKLVTIDVPAKTYDATTGWAGAYDYGALGDICDLVIVMAYDYHWSGGPAGAISPLGWFEDVVRYASSVIPASRLMIGMPFYGYDWPTGGTASGLTFDEALEISTEMNRTIRFDEASGEYTFTYIKDNTRREVWFQGAQSIELRIQILKNHGVDQVAAWRIGQEDPRTWEVIGPG